MARLGFGAAAAAVALLAGQAWAFMPRAGPTRTVGSRVTAPVRVTDFALYSTASSEGLQTTVEKLANSSVGLTVVLPGEATRKAYEQACKRLVNDRKAPLPGYRKGSKVPESVLMNMVGGPDVIANEALDILCEDALKKAIVESGVKAVGQAKLVSNPRTLLDSYKPGESLVMEVTVDVYPEVKFTGDYKGLQVTVERVPLEDEKVKAALEAIRKKRVKLVDVPEGTTAQLGDSCMVNMKAYQKLSDGSRGPELKNIAMGENVEVVMEEGRFLPGVVENLVGAKPGDVRVVAVTFPEQIRDPKLAGLKAEFEIEVLSVKSRVLPEIDDEFAASIREGLTAEEIRKEVIDAVNSDAEALTKANRDRALEEELLKLVEAEVPETWIIDETRRKFAAMMQDISRQGRSEEEVKQMITKENFEKYREVALPGTIRTLQLGAAVALIAEEQRFEVDPIELQDQVDLRRIEAERSGMTLEALKDQIEAKMLADKVMDFLADNAEITYVDQKQA